MRVLAVHPGPLMYMPRTDWFVKSMLLPAARPELFPLPCKAGFTDYQVLLPPEHETSPVARGRSLYIHAPRGRAGRAIDAATERFVDETRMGATP